MRATYYFESQRRKVLKSLGLFPNGNSTSNFTVKQQTHSKLAMKAGPCELKRLKYPNREVKKDMENIYAAMLLHKAGKEINEETVTAVLTAAGLKVDAVQVKALVASLSEVNIDEAIKAAPTMMAAAPVAAAGAEAKPAAAAPEDKKKKAEEEKAKEEAALEGLGALFG
jgi:large subunit ribosomal protein L12